MTKKGQYVVDAFRALSLGQCRPGDHDDGKAELTRGFDLGKRAGASRVAGDDPFDIPRTHQIEIAGEGEGAARNNDAGVGHRQRSIRSIGKSQSVGVLRPCGERREMPTANGEKYAGALFGKCCGRGRHVLDLDPAVVRRSLPRRALKCDQRGSRRCAGGDRVVAHLDRKRMRRIDNMRDLMSPDIVDQAAGAAEAADAGRQRLSRRRLGAAGVGIGRVKPELRDGLRQTIGVAGTAQYEGTRHD